MKYLFIAAALALSTQSLADTIIVQSTTSTKNSGLYDYLLPMIKDTGIQVNVVAVGTGQAIKNARRCDGDVLLVHAKEAEERFVADGYGEYRHDLMYNDFVIVGPETDPAKVASASDVIEALRRIRQADAKFASRGDDSGTHKRNAPCGKRRVLTQSKVLANGTLKPAAAWAPPSTPAWASVPMC